MAVYRALRKMGRCSEDLQFVQAGPRIRDLPSASPTGIDGSAFDECYVRSSAPFTLRYGDWFRYSGGLYRVVLKMATAI